MKILLIHTSYLHQGGEDSVFEQEKKLLSVEHEVKSILFKNSSGLRGAFQFLFSIWNIFEARKIKAMLQKFEPDVVHLHNWHFAIGPIVIHTIKKMGLPVVITIHNYRLLCPSATLMRNDEIFTNSINQNFPWEAVGSRVYRNSRLQTFWLSFIIWFHSKLGTWKLVDQYITLTAFAKNLHVNSNREMPIDRITVKPNFVDRIASPPLSPRVNYLFIGRLSEEKGVPKLLNVFSENQLNLNIAGTGNLESLVLKFSAAHHNINYLGNLSKKEVIGQLAAAEVLIFPSIWFEGMPMTIIEAFRSSTPVIASNLGAMASMITDGYNGLHYDGTEAGLFQKILEWEKMDNGQKQNLRKGALASYEELYSPETNLKQLVSIYKSVIKKE